MIMRVVKCRSCPASIIWTRTVANNKLMPVDAVPVAGGNVRLIDGYVPLAEVVEPLDGEELYVSHFKTCPDARGWRKT